RNSLCGGEGDLDGARGDPVSWRQRLYQRLPDGAAVARRQAVRDRRRYQRDPSHADRPRAVPRDDMNEARVHTENTESHREPLRKERRAARSAVFVLRAALWSSVFSVWTLSAG